MSSLLHQSYLPCDGRVFSSRSSDEESFDKEGELEREQDERWAMEDEEKLSKDYEAIW